MGLKVTTEILLGILIGICGITLIVSIVIAARQGKSTTASQPKPQPSAPKGPCSGTPQRWQDAACCPSTCPRNWDPLPLLLISLDGFRADYLKQHKTPAIQTLRECGIMAPFMYSAYPTKTFPNHYSIVTGLYPESHGIVDNHMYDPNITPAKDRVFGLGQASSFNPQWWHGEPFWNTVMKNGMKAGTYFWPGSEVKIQNMRPNYYRTFNGSVPYSSRVDTVIEWLLSDDSARPSFFTLYQDNPDHIGHEFGPGSPEVSNELLIVDGVVNYVMTRLYENNLVNCVNVVITADHGMQQLNPKENIGLQGYVDTTGMRVFGGPVAMVETANSSITPDQAVKSLLCKNDSFTTYLRKDVPYRFHLSKSVRSGDFIVNSIPGYLVWQDQPTYFLQGQHGYDFRYESMHALFVAQGPAFKKNYTVPPFQNTELYNLFCDVLKIKKRAPNNGTEGALSHMLRNPPSVVGTSASVPSQCAGVGAQEQCGCSQQLVTSKCPSSPLLAYPTNALSGLNVCQLNQCPMSGLFHSVQLNAPLLAQGVVARSSSVYVGAGQSCSSVLSGWISCKQVQTLQASLGTINMAFFPLFPFFNPGQTLASQGTVFFSQSVPMYTSFYKGVWTQLLNMALSAGNKYGKIWVASGPIYDYDHNGDMDTLFQIKQNALSNGLSIPTSYYQVHLRCTSSSCTTQSFILPHIPKPRNCQKVYDYLYMHTARVRDIELLTGLQFFANTTAWTQEAAFQMRIHVNQRIWS